MEFNPCMEECVANKFDLPRIARTLSGRSSHLKTPLRRVCTTCVRIQLRYMERTTCDAQIDALSGGHLNQLPRSNPTWSIQEMDSASSTYECSNRGSHCSLASLPYRSKFSIMVEMEAESHGI